jgi:hypothetical protein
MSGVNAHAIVRLPDAPTAPTLSLAASSSSSGSFAWRRQDMSAGVLPVGRQFVYMAAAGSSSSRSTYQFLLPVLERPGLSWLWDHQVGCNNKQLIHTCTVQTLHSR